MFWGAHVSIPEERRPRERESKMTSHSARVTSTTFFFYAGAMTCGGDRALQTSRNVLSISEKHMRAAYCTREDGLHAAQCLPCFGKVTRRNPYERAMQQTKLKIDK